MAAVSNPSDGWRPRGDVLVAVFVCVAVMMLLVPLPALLLDLGMALNVAMSLLLILMVLYARNTAEFTSFPTLLLLATLFGLALNVSSTRLILAHGAAFDGRIVRAFGSFVVGSSGVAGIVVGLIIFIIVIAVQVVVITRGAARVAEVAARFTLDALPGRQMAIDAEYASGRITEAQARRRQQDLQRQADFYGAMDGASKFVSGNVRVALFITAVNLAGGFIIGVSVHGEPLAAAAHTYVSLTIGDGLVTQLPALLISTATGIVVTRAASDAPFGHDAARQLGRYDRPFYVTAAFLALLALLPGFPPYLLLPLALALAALGRAVGNSAPRVREPSAAAAKEAAAAAGAEREHAGGVLPASPAPLALEIGYALLAATEGEQGAELLRGVAAVRQRVARDCGFEVPAVRITDNLELPPTAYLFKIRGVEVGSGRCRGARGCGAALVEQLGEVVRCHASELLGRDQVRSMLEALREDYPTLIAEATAALTVGEIRLVLQGLLREAVSIRDLVTILEALADHAPQNRDVDFLMREVRRALGRQISMQHSDSGGVLRVVTLAPELERRLLAAAGAGALADPAVGGEGEFRSRCMAALAGNVERAAVDGRRPVVVASDDLRAPLKHSMARRMPELVCLAAGEVAAAPEVRRVAEVRLDEEGA